MHHSRATYLQMTAGTLYTCPWHLTEECLARLGTVCHVHQCRVFSENINIDSERYRGRGSKRGSETWVEYTAT